MSTDIIESGASGAAPRKSVYAELRKNPYLFGLSTVSIDIIVSSSVLKSYSSHLSVASSSVMIRVS
jgi:hypothetical protein